MAKFKVGDKVVIKDDLNFHGFENGEVIIIKEVDKYGGYTGYRVGDAPENWMCFDDREIEEYKEESKVRVTSKVEPMCIYSFDSVEDMRKFIRIADQDGFNVTMCERGIKENGLKNKFRVCKNKFINYGTYAYDVPEYPEYERVQFKVEEEKQMSKCKFKVGDLVKGKYPDRYVYTNDKMTKGMVISVYDQDFIRVKVLEHLDVASGFEGCEFDVDPQYFDFYEEPKLVQKEKPKATVLKLGEYKIVFNGDTTVVTDGTKKGVAKRHPDDEYDAVVGLQVALERFHGGRKPKIGDKVRVLKVDGNSRYGRHSYSIGDIVTVIDFAYGGGGKGTDIYCENRCDFRQTLITGEYEVLG